MRDSGTYIKQPEGFRAFIPRPLPPVPPLSVDAEMLRLLSEADCALGRLDGLASVLPNPDLFVAMYVKHEAVLSSQIEGTQSTLDDVLLWDLDDSGGEQLADVGEVVNYVSAMNHGIARLKALPLSLRLIREIHGKLMSGVRGGMKTPGEFRRSQNWIGGTAPGNAIFVPPPVHEMHAALDNFEKFLHNRTDFPILIQSAIAHAQFETIHPFLDGNGRVGRLLITLLLYEREVLHRPLLYLSLYLKARRNEYYESLTAVRERGDWEGWVRFFIQGVAVVSREAALTVRRILTLRKQHHELVIRKLRGNLALELMELIFEHPMINAGLVQKRLRCSFPTAAKLIGKFVKLGILAEVSGQHRNRRYRYESFLRVFEREISA